jgi:predicted metal-dependent hydrolase
MLVTLDDLSHELKARWNEGIRLFNERQFWEAHEAWEDVWHVLRDDRHTYVQGLIQAAAAFVHLTNGNENGCRSQSRKALEKLEQFGELNPIPIVDLKRQLKKMMETGQLSGEDPVTLNAPMLS